MSKTDTLAFTQRCFNKYAPDNLPTDKELEREWQDFIEDKPKPVIKPKEIAPTALLIANELLSAVYLRYEWMKPKTNIDNEKTVRGNALHIERLNTVDGYDYEFIRAVALWSQQDSFWRQNIRSAEKLRKQFNQLLVNIKEQKSNAQGVEI